MTDTIIRPHNDEAERSVLGAMLLDRDAAEIASTGLVAKDFYSTPNKLVFGAMVRLTDRGTDIDELIVENELGAESGAAGGLDYLRHLVKGTISAARIEHHMQIVRDASVLRRLQWLAESVSVQVQTAGVSVGAVLEEADKELTAITMGADSMELTEYSDILQELIEAEPGKMKSSVETGYIDLDRLGAMIGRGRLTVIAAPSSMGKTSFAVNIIKKCQPAPVLMFSLEMQKEAIGELLVQIGARVDTSKWHKPDATNWPNAQERHLFQQEAMNQIDLKYEVWIDDEACSMRDIRARARRYKRRHDIQLIVIDYLQMMDDPENVQNRHQAVGSNALACKRLAKELDVPVILLSQLSQDAEKATDGTPIKSWLRYLKESGDIRNHADAVLFIHRPGFYDESAPSPKGDEVEIIAAKNRIGPTGRAKMWWFGQWRRFDNQKQED
jgi:replicative DNA helicase